MISATELFLKSKMFQASFFPTSPFLQKVNVSKGKVFLKKNKKDNVSDQDLDLVSIQ